MKACNEMQTVHGHTVSMTNQLIMIHQQKKKKRNHTSTHKNETLECHGQDQQTVIDEILF